MPSQTQGRFIKHEVNMVNGSVVDSLGIEEGVQVTFEGVVDRFQSITALANAIPPTQTSTATSIHISRDALKNIASTEIEWFRITGAGSNPEQLNGTIISMAFTRDGDIIYAGTSSGEVYRVSGLNAARVHLLNVKELVLSEEGQLQESQLIQIILIMLL